MGKTIKFGRYLLERRLALGGMAEVFLGRIEGPEGFQKRVVLKRILPHLQADDNHVTMFLDEARLAARFDHPNLIQVYELARIDEQYCLVMEYLEGEDVASLLDESLRLSKKIPVELCALIIAGAAEGLHYAHELTTEKGEPLNVVHRDISPANIIITSRGGVKIVDFGIAKHEIAHSHTVQGTLKGKFSYMSPEQARGQVVDRRSDIFSLGIILYELLTLSPCFTAKSQIETLDKVASLKFNPLHKVRPDVPEALQKIVGRMLTEKDTRYQTANDVRADLQRFLVFCKMPTAMDLANLLERVFGHGVGKVPRHVGTAILDFDSLPVTDELSSPDVIPDDKTYQQLRESQVMSTSSVNVDMDGGISGEVFLDGLNLVEAIGPTIETSVRTGTGLEPFDIPSREMSPRRRSTISRVADKLRQPRYWPTTLMIMAVAMAVSAIALVMIYRAAMGMPWQPDQLFDEVLGSSPPPLESGEEIGSGTLQVITVPPGAVVAVDDERQPGQSPLTVDNLSVGLPHRVVVELPGFKKAAQELTLNEDGSLRTLTLDLVSDDKVPGQVDVAVNSDPAGAVIVVDGVLSSEKTPATIGLPHGVAAKFEVHLPGFTCKPTDFVPELKGHNEVNFPLEPVAVSKTGFVDIHSEPRTEVYIGGKRVGLTPIRRYELPVGPVVVDLRNIKLGLRKTLRLDVVPSEVLSRRVVFRKGQVVFDARPWADVYLGRRKLGTTPMAPVSLFEGTYAIRFVNERLGVERVVQVSVKPGKTRRIVQKLR
ncbi:MAG: hypothetical protein A2289_07515 [Deltaproteobacteria bacterium RIFOXYA12_FULL_58_15]|nr:MAG: hypothetical protein A2289_07515 [Deltaproteobacteria bacterium RIFOXYA12_FULL_58_15]OGR10203.1 MAG: hypothetical protein A2341_06285 [Deltaproteobacteria bacterium RIFOXYB12_FULL_58_9]